MSRRLLGLLALLLITVTLPAAAAGTRILLVARDHEEHPLSGFRFTYLGLKTLPTDQGGATELDLPPEHRPGQPVKILLLVPNAKQAEEWFLVNSLVNIPAPGTPAEVVLMRRSAFRQIAAEARDASRHAVSGQPELTTEDRKRVLVEAAARHGLTADQLETALRSFAETQDPKDKGIAAYMAGEFAKAEDLLNQIAEKKESDFVDTLYYLGASQYEQGKYRAAADTFRRAVSLRGEDSVLLSWLAVSLHQLAEWAEAEPLMRRALAIDEKNLGREHPSVARDLNNLATLLQATNRLNKAEPLMRRALAIDEKSLGKEHPNVAAALNNLAQLLYATNRLDEAEPLMRRALAIYERSFGPEHPNVATALNNLAGLLQSTQLFGEAEPLMRQALAIDEKSLGFEHPKVATDFNNLAQLLQDTNRLGEAELLMRRTLTIDEKSFGPEHPNVARDLGNLARLLQATNRLGEAEPLVRRALAIDERILGSEHPDVATALNNLARLLQDTNRLNEAEPLMRRSLSIFLHFLLRTGSVHPYLLDAFANYRALLKAMGKSDAEIEAALTGVK